MYVIIYFTVLYYSIIHIICDVNQRLFYVTEMKEAFQQQRSHHL